MKISQFFFSAIFCLIISCSNTAIIHSEFGNGEVSNHRHNSNNKIAKQSNSITTNEALNNAGLISNSLIGSSTAYANASVTIVNPTILKKSSDLIFNRIALNQLSKKNVAIKSIGANYKSIAVPEMYSFQATELAEFNFENSQHSVYDITFSNLVNLQQVNGTEMVLAKLSVKETTLSSNQHQFLIDGSIYINTLSKAGQYVSNDCTITLHLN